MKFSESKIEEMDIDVLCMIKVGKEKEKGGGGGLIQEWCGGGVRSRGEVE